MKIYLRNMVCQGTRLLVIKELAKLGLKFSSFEFSEIHFEKDLSLSEINELNQSLKKMGLDVIFRNSKLVKEIRDVINADR